ncbi:DUF1007 domain-containing protein [Superficieibacter electus]|uniref:DUF1007 domain-containing protein n=1 Tax=Superficieibacter electus TaxID=2022662 RepID=A0A2P5GKR5_9ENTR|nr:DUF1007 family protein [Superficieibacter electus]POP42541.1 DUF1007 domain-containing protein [Superficieibacter electus]POP45155.1 DUF1007 domain-containing protein [Superficieibacter electus]
MNRGNACALALVFTFLSLPVAAHPHSFISMRSETITANGQFTALKMRWTMDEITSADLLYDAGNAKPGDEIWKKLAAEVMANVLGQHYFTEVWHNGQKVKFMNRPSEYQLAREGHKAVLTFILPLAEPQPLSGQTYTVSTFDPTYFVDMHYDGEGDVTFAGNNPSHCTLALQTPKPNEKMTAYALSLDKADAPPEDMDLGKQFAQKVILQCPSS